MNITPSNGEKARINNESGTAFPTFIL